MSVCKDNPKHLIRIGDAEKNRMLDSDWRYEQYLKSILMSKCCNAPMLEGEHTLYCTNCRKSYPKTK